MVAEEGVGGGCVSNLCDMLGLRYNVSKRMFLEILPAGYTESWAISWVECRALSMFRLLE